ncbi:hypothetical protein NDN08_001579 [Rhodosorus marinus]|uniref:Alpha-(1,6)-fucosyltransferase N- and catalytic domain-containing protein n=1 Tax=Rhodosorus marinus TaxID=101924 RepID=A0AAV8UU06_9RHOD|nr:hypothetical protein NDN08_001579 [Rhodosorus marinus]
MLSKVKNGTAASKAVLLTMLLGAGFAIFFTRGGERSGMDLVNKDLEEPMPDPLSAIKRYHEVVEADMPSVDSLGFMPRCDRIVMYHDQKGNGLGAQVLRVFDAYMLAMQTNSTLLIARQMYWNYGCDLYVTWECYFESLTPYCMDSKNQLRRVDTMISPEKCDTFRAATYKDSDCLVIADTIAEDQLYHVVHDGETQIGHEKAFEEVKKNMKHVWKPNRNIQERTSDAMQRIDLRPDEFVGLHIRRGDKALEVPLIPLESYAEIVRMCDPAISKIFLATDDGSIIWELRDLLPEYAIYTFADPQSTGHLQRNANEDPMRQTVLSTMSLVAEIDILRQAKYFIGTYSSNIGRLLAVLRDKDIRTSISMDVAWSSGVAWRSFNTDYCMGYHPKQGYCEWKRKHEELIDEDGFFF